MNIDAAAELARAWVTAIRHAKHYGVDHQATAGSIEELFIGVRAHLQTPGVLRIAADADWLRLGTAALPVEHKHAGALAAHLVARRIRSLALRPEVAREAIGTLIRLLALEPEELIAAGGPVEALQQAGARGIDVVEAGAAAPEQRPASGADPVSEAASTLAHLTAEAVDAHIDLARARQAVEDLAGALSRAPLMVWRAVAPRAHDELDPMHGVATAVLTMAAAGAMEVAEQPRVDLGVAAMLHDIGLAALPPHQRGRERTTEGAQDAWRHPAEGGHILREAENGGNLAMVVAMEHHLPALHRSDVLPQSRLVGLADYVDAMTTARILPLRAGTIDSVMEHLLAGEGPQFDPVHVRVLAAVLHDAALAGADFWS